MVKKFRPSVLLVVDKADIFLVSVLKVSYHWSMILKWMLQKYISGHGVK